MQRIESLRFSIDVYAIHESVSICALNGLLEVVTSMSVHRKETWGQAFIVHITGEI